MFARVWWGLDDRVDREDSSMRFDDELRAVIRFRKRWF
jgi:hypothetical protein